MDPLGSLGDKHYGDHPLLCLLHGGYGLRELLLMHILRKKTGLGKASGSPAWVMTHEEDFKSVRTPKDRDPENR